MAASAFFCVEPSNIGALGSAACYRRDARMNERCFFASFFAPKKVREPLIIKEVLWWLEKTPYIKEKPSGCRKFFRKKR